MTDVLDFAKRLIAAPSVTPATGEVFDAMEDMLAPLGFTVTRFTRGDGEAGLPEAPVENLFAVRRGPPDSKHFAFAGHLDVVPPGDGWASGAFEPEIRGDLLYGRGAVDMKGAIACMAAAVADVPEDAGTVSFIITGDEEGPALHGTRALIDWMREQGEQPDLCLVGEPTSVDRLGDMMKIGRRGSVNIWLEVEGTQGHVAYPHLADNPIPKLVAMLAELDALVLDEGTDWFQPSNLEITDLEVVVRKGRRHREEAWRHRAAHRLRRAVPDPAGRVFRHHRQRSKGGNRRRSRAFHHRGHVRCALPACRLPSDRIRAGQCDHA